MYIHVFTCIYDVCVCVCVHGWIDRDTRARGHSMVIISTWSAVWPYDLTKINLGSCIIFQDITRCRYPRNT